jgi:hypothetical protein
MWAPHGGREGILVCGIEMGERIEGRQPAAPHNLIKIPHPHGHSLPHLAHEQNRHGEQRETERDTAPTPFGASISMW